MSRILYGVMGDARGHVARALTVAQEMPHHEFLFVGGGQVQNLKSSGYQVEAVPVLATFYKNNRVDMFSTAANALKVFFRNSIVIHRLSDVIKEFDPDLILSDYEYFTPLAANLIERDCLSIDNQHIITHCLYEAPRSEKLSRLLTSSSIKYLFSNCSKFIIVSLFDLPPIDPSITFVIPPLIRKAVRSIEPVEGEHILVYQTSPTFHHLFPILKRMKRKFIIYGFGKRSEEKNLFFKAHSNEDFLEDLASARYAITNGGYNVLCEAIHFEKPTLAFPIANAYEQYFNSYFLSKFGYGRYSSLRMPSTNVFSDFENEVDQLKSNISKGKFLGNSNLLDLLDNILNNPTQNRTGWIQI